MCKAGVDPCHPLIIEEEDRPLPFKAWAGVIRKVYEIDLLLCPHCGAEMKVIAFIEDHKVIENFITGRTHEEFEVL